MNLIGVGYHFMILAREVVYVESFRPDQFAAIKGADSSVASLPEGRPEPSEAVAGDREHFVHGRLELELPVSAVGLQPKEPDAGNVDGVFAVDADETEGLEQRRHLTDRPDIHKRCTRAQADLGFPTPRSEVVHILGVEHAMLASGDVNDDTADRHTDFVTRPGRYAHRLVNRSTGWPFGE